MVIVLWMSSGAFSADETGGFLVPLFRWLLQRATPAQLDVLHAAGRKLAHLAEYAVLALLWFRALRRENTASRTAAWGAWSVAVGCALLDESLQSTTTSRTGSVVDVAIDATGATLALTA